jgi:hypothetical protein
VDFIPFNVAGARDPTGRSKRPDHARAVASFNVAGARDPIGGGGCSNINLYRYRYSNANMYYNIPTIVNDSIYIGSSEGFNWKKTSHNYFGSRQYHEKMWYWNLGAEEVRGAAARPHRNYVYFVTKEDGAKQNCMGT